MLMIWSLLPLLCSEAVSNYKVKNIIESKYFSPEFHFDGEILYILLAPSISFLLPGRWRKTKLYARGRRRA